MLHFSLPTISQKMTQAKKLFLLLLCIAIGQVLMAQTTYTTIGSNSFIFDDPSNWLNGQAPPNPIPADATVEIQHQAYLLGSLPKWTNNGTINISNDGFFSVGNEFDNYGTINIADNDFMQINAGIINNKSGGIIQGWHLSFWNTTTLNNEAGGKLEIKASLNLTSQGNNVINNAGTIILNGGFTCRGPLTNMAGGLIEMNGTNFFVNSTFTNSGALKLTGQGQLSQGISGVYAGLAGSSLEWVLSASGGAGVNYPYVSFSNATGSFDQTSFTVSLALGYVPTEGDVFTLFRGADVPTNTISLPTLPGGKMWKNNSTSTEITLAVEEGSGGGGGGGNPGSDMTSVPTMSQWGLILFALLILTLSTITAMQRELTTEGTGNSSFSIKHFPFEKRSFIFWLVGTALALMLIFTVAILFAGYELTNADLPGSLLAIPIAAYLLHLLFGDKSSE